MKKLCVGVFLASALLFAPSAFAEPCGLCQAYYPCSWSCEHCVESSSGPGLWIDGGGCWGDVVPGTCGDTGNCRGYFSASTGSSESVVSRDVKRSRGAGTAVLGKAIAEDGQAPCFGFSQEALPGQAAKP